jgi:hypothetical protein
VRFVVRTSYTRTTVMLLRIAVLLLHSLFFNFVFIFCDRFSSSAYFSQIAWHQMHLQERKCWSERRCVCRVYPTTRHSRRLSHSCLTKMHLIYSTFPIILSAAYSATYHQLSLDRSVFYLLMMRKRRNMIEKSGGLRYFVSSDIRAIVRSHYCNLHFV